MPTTRETGPDVPVIEGVRQRRAVPLGRRLRVSDRGTLAFRAGPATAGLTSGLVFADRQGKLTPLNFPAAVPNAPAAPDASASRWSRHGRAFVSVSETSGLARRAESPSAQGSTRDLAPDCLRLAFQSAGMAIPPSSRSSPMARAPRTFDNSRAGETHGRHRGLDTAVRCCSSTWSKAPALIVTLSLTDKKQRRSRCAIDAVTWRFSAPASLVA